MLKKTGIVLIAISGLVVLQSPQAALIEMDLNTIGDGLVTFDSETGLEWLDLSESAGWSASNVSTGFSAGGTFEGWRYATADEWLQLITAAGLSAWLAPVNPDTASYTPEDLQSLLYLIGAPNYVGQTAGYVSEASLGTTAEDRGFDPSHPQADYNLLAPLTFTLYSWMYVGSFDVYWNPEFVNNSGHYLVRNSVPAPASLALMSLGLIGLGFARRKR